MRPGERGCPLQPAVILVEALRRREMRGRRPCRWRSMVAGWSRAVAGLAIAESMHVAALAALCRSVRWDPHADGVAAVLRHQAPVRPAADRAGRTPRYAAGLLQRHISTPCRWAGRSRCRLSRVSSCGIITCTCSFVAAALTSSLPGPSFCRGRLWSFPGYPSTPSRPDAAAVRACCSASSSRRAIASSRRASGRRIAGRRSGATATVSWAGTISGHGGVRLRTAPPPPGLAHAARPARQPRTAAAGGFSSAISARRAMMRDGARPAGDGDQGSGRGVGHATEGIAWPSRPCGRPWESCGASIFRAGRGARPGGRRLDPRSGLDR